MSNSLTIYIHSLLSITFLVALSSCSVQLADGVFSGDNSSASLNLTPAPCFGNDPYVPMPSGPHGLYAFAPPNPPPAYLLDTPTICGGNFFVIWSDVDKGPGNNPQYDWSKIEKQIAPWTAAGKKVNLLIEIVGWGPTNTSTPQYVLNQIPTVSCSKLSPVPVFWNSTFEGLYQTFMTAVMAQYGSDPRVGYIRFGMSNGAQSGVYSDICDQQLEQVGLTPQVWEGYIDTMATYEAALPHTNTLTLSLGPYQLTNDISVPDFDGALAVSLGLGIGNQGLSLLDIQNYNSNPPQPCSGDWCANFTNPNYIGKVPFYLQQDGLSCPGGGCQVGPLTTVYPFALSLNTQIFEVYTDDLGVAYDPNNSEYAQYGASYRQLFQNMATLLGTMP